MLACDAQRSPAGDERADAAARAEDGADGRGGVEEVLEVVEEEQELPPAQESGEVVRRADRLRDLGVEERGVGKAGERHPEDAVALRADELGRDLEREPRLAGAARPRECDETLAVGEQRDELLDLALTAGERARRERQVGGVERAKGREVPVAELEQTLRMDEILQPMLAEIANGCVCIEEPSRRLGEDDLASVGRRCDASSAVDVHAHVALVRHERLAGVEADADADRPGCEAFSRFLGGAHGLDRSRERDEERVSLRVDLDAVMSCEGCSQRRAVLGEEVGITVSVLTEKARRALDIREEEGDRAARKVEPAHPTIISSR